MPSRLFCRRRRDISGKLTGATTCGLSQVRCSCPGCPSLGRLKSLHRVRWDGADWRAPVRSDRATTKKRMSGGIACRLPDCGHRTTARSADLIHMYAASRRIVMRAFHAPDHPARLELRSVAVKAYQRLTASRLAILEASECQWITVPTSHPPRSRRGDYLSRRTCSRTVGLRELGNRRDQRIRCGSAAACILPAASQCGHVITEHRTRTRNHNVHKSTSRHRQVRSARCRVFPTEP